MTAFQQTTALHSLALLAQDDTNVRKRLAQRLAHAVIMEFPEHVLHPSVLNQSLQDFLHVLFAHAAEKADLVPLLQALKAQPFDEPQLRMLIAVTAHSDGPKAISFNTFPVGYARLSIQCESLVFQQQQWPLMT